MAERISLVEAYNNRDVVAQLVRLRNDVNEILAILEDIDPQGDLTNFVTKTGDEVISGIKTFTGKIVADCDIIQNGSAYETHAEQVFTTKDYINMRDGAIAALAPGDLSGIEIENYDGNATNCRLAVDASGVARVGDAGDEQPLATRDEVADMTSGALVKWDGVNMKMIAPSSNVGSDSKPVKIVNGEPVAVASDLQTKLEVTTVESGSGYSIKKYGAVVIVALYGFSVSAGANTVTSGAPLASTYSLCRVVNTSGTDIGYANIQPSTRTVGVTATASGTVYGSLIYLTSE